MNLLRHLFFLRMRRWRGPVEKSPSLYVRSTRSGDSHSNDAKSTKGKLLKIGMLEESCFF
jgi:hypothetical protein